VNRSITFLLVLLFAGAAVADELRDKYDDKIRKDFINKIPWEQNYDQALAKSKETGKPIFAYFTRSYAP
jgi:hypothetical protein